MGKRQKEGMKGGSQGRKSGKRTRTATAGSKCQVGLVIFASRREAQSASHTGRAKRCGRCRQWHPDD